LLRHGAAARLSRFLFWSRGYIAGLILHGTPEATIEKMAILRRALTTLERPKFSAKASCFARKQE
jgi:hypothetical protein